MKQLLLNSENRHVARFLLVGSIGFLVDATLLKLFIVLVNDSPILGRVVSFPVAVTVTWWLNRRYTFLSKDVRLHREWLAYVVVNSIGLTVNMLVFMLVFFVYSKTQAYPIAVLVLASIIAMFFNYIGSKYLVFVRKKAT